MKSNPLRYLGLLFLCGMSYGQQFENFGIILGVNHSYLTYPKYFEESVNPKNKVKLGPVIGGYANIPISKDLYVNIDLLFLEKGDRYEIEVLNETQTAMKTIKYLSLSPKLGASLEFETISPYLLFGPGINLILSGTAKLSGQPDIHMTDDLKTISPDLVFASGIEINKLSAIAEFRYYLGLSNLPDKDWVDFKPRSIAFLMGKKF